MIRVSVHLISAVNGSVTELARMDIANDGRANNTLQMHYDGVTYIGRDKDRLDKGTPSKRGRIESWRRDQFHVWNLVYHMLASMGYTQGRK
jgi:hypothetical protein